MCEGYRPLSYGVVNSSRPIVRAPVYPPIFGSYSFIRLVSETQIYFSVKKLQHRSGRNERELPLQLLPQFFDLLVLLGQDLLHVAIGCGLLELLLQLLQM